MQVSVEDVPEHDSPVGGVLPLEGPLLMSSAEEPWLSIAEGVQQGRTEPDVRPEERRLVIDGQACSRKRRAASTENPRASRRRKSDVASPFVHVWRLDQSQTPAVGAGSLHESETAPPPQVLGAAVPTWSHRPSGSSTLAGSSGPVASSSAVCMDSSRNGAQTFMDSLTLVRDDIVDCHPSYVPSGAVIRASHLTQWYSFVGICSAQCSVRGNNVAVHSPSLGLLLDNYQGWTRAQLRVIAAAHGCVSAGNDSRQSIRTMLSERHTCSEVCHNVRYEFRMCMNERKRYNQNEERTTIGGSRVQNRNIRFVGPRIGFDPCPVATEGVSESERFPEICSNERKFEIIREFQEHFADDKWKQRACAVCGQGKSAKDVEDIAVGKVDLRLLRNDDIDSDLWPKDYNFERFDRAFLESAGLSDKDQRQQMSVCRSCAMYLNRKEQPPDSIANYQYYAHERLPVDVRDAFAQASVHDLQLASACRATQISFSYTADRAGKAMSQRYCKGNVAIVPQDVGRVLQVVPPTPEEMEYSMCVLFVGGKKPTQEDVMKLHPVLVHKRRVETILKFLTTRNKYYMKEGISFSPENLDALCPAATFPDGVGLTAAVEICHLPDHERAATAPQSSYTDRCQDITPPDNELYMEVVGYSSADVDAVDRNSSKMTALKWFSEHRNHLQVRAGSELFPDQDERMLTFLFPRLDPYGLGGFNNPLRVGRQHISMHRQLRNLLHRYKSPFEEDAAFAYVCWNVLQKLEATRSVSFRVRDDQYKGLCDELIECGDILEVMEKKWELHPDAEPSNAEEKRALSLLHKLRVISKELKGSNGHRLKLRNEIRAMLKVHGCPALFITLNPADIHHRLVHILAGADPESFRELNAFQRAKQVAQHPKAAAMFFDHMIDAFVRLILRHGDPRPGLFGTSKAYYGTVEAQGRGTLHCHMLIWLKGNLSPQALRDKMQNEDGFKILMFSWIESIVKCELYDMNNVLECRPNESLPRPRRERAEDIRTSEGPHLPDNLNAQSRELFMFNFQEFVKELAIECNWHEHRDTCWKHLRPGEPRDDAHCRMRMDGKTRSFTDLDPETLGIRLRRLHPWINNYNELIMFLMRCNMDIKFIGSGEAAKALVYYVTDYITKAALPTHQGLGALCYAIRMNAKKYGEPNETAESTVRRSLLIKVVNAMMARQEISHQQVMSYLLGGGDHYTSDTFRTLYWGELDRYVRVHENAAGDDCNFADNADQVLATERDVEDLLGATEQTGDERCREPFGRSGNGTESDLTDDGYLAQPTGQENVPFTMKEGQVNVSSLLYDYRFRSTHVSFEALSVWDHVAWVEKVTKTQEERRLRRPKKNRNCSAAERVPFSSEKHPQFDSHISRLRRQAVVPVYLGGAISRPDGSDEQAVEYCRCMLILFKPWRKITDLKAPDIDWKGAFATYNFSDRAKAVMKNMHIERECKDARSAHEDARRRGEVQGLLSADNDQYRRNEPPEDGIQDSGIPDCDIGPYAQDGVEIEAVSDNRTERSKKRRAQDDARITETVAVMERAGFFEYENNSSLAAGVQDQFSYEPSDDERKQHQKAMECLKKHKRPQLKQVNLEADGDLTKPRNFPPSVTVTSLRQDAIRAYDIEDLPMEGPPTRENILETVLVKNNIIGNVEQEMAVRQVGEHFLRDDDEQQMWYVSGVGGTGKSHVIKTIVELFQRCGASDHLLLGAYTGIAAVLIGGCTLHALGFLPKSFNKAKKDELIQTWKNVKYLIIDEISMVSPNLLHDLSSRIAEAKSWRPGAANLPFGGVNVLFTGDFGQLKPVEAPSLLSHNLVNTLQANQGQTCQGQNALHGVSLWRQVDNVVELQKNWRQNGDSAYADLIARIRFGRASTEDRGDQPSDYETLSGRLLNILKIRDPDCISSFADAPIIVATRRMRDAVNMRAVQAKSKQLRRTVKIYVSRDTEHRTRLTGPTASRVQALQPSLTGESYGRLPLFLGMRVMISDNADVLHGIANGAEGYVEHISVALDTESKEYATSAYVRVKGSGFQVEGLEVDLVPVFPLRTSFVYHAMDGTTHHIGRLQLPLVPAYAYTDYKSQGRSLTKAIMDIAGCSSLQSVYVMLSRVKTLDGVAILRWFPPLKIADGLKHEFREEFDRLHALAEKTRQRYVETHRA